MNSNASATEDGSARPEAAGSTSGTPSLGQRLADVITSVGHSPDFTATRNEHIRGRLALVQLFFALGFLAWIPLDYFMFESEQARAVMVARIVLAVVLFVLWRINRTAHAHGVTEALVGATLLAIALFHAVSVAILSGTTADELLGGYRALPFVLVVLTALFPMTLVMGVSLIAMILTLYVGVELYLGTLLTMASFNTLWMLVLVGAVVLWIQSGQLYTELQLHREASRDPLTGVNSRRTFLRELRRERGRCERWEIPLALLGIQLDQIEKIEDDYGHEERDQVIQQAADAVRAQFGDTEQVCRYSGALFLMALPGSNPIDAVERSENLRWALRRQPFVAPDGERITLTASFGVTECLAGDGAIEEAIDRVDRAVHEARHAGGNRAMTRTAGKA